MIMKSSYRIFRIFGISVELHITFILFLLLVSLFGPANVIFWLSIFAIVLMHELTHSIVAMKFGIKVPRITLTPIGGLASIEVPEDPKKELLISIAGPLSNFVLASTIYLLFISTSLTVHSYSFIIQRLSMSNANILDPSFLLSGILWVNLILGLFNVIPGFPMDGGRVLRAVLALWIDHVRATKIAVRIGQLMAFFMIISGIFVNPWLILIGVFLYYAGSSEFQLVKIKHALRGLKIGTLAMRNMRHANEYMTIGEFVRLIARPDQDYYPISDQSGRVIGVLNIQELKKVHREDFDKILVRDIANPRFNVLDAHLNAEEVVGKLLGMGFSLVVDSGRVIGYLTPEHILETAQFYNLLSKKSVTT
ncbi:MAG: hypothetical protein DRO89_02645 [Candidatus Altiarchaeales archaeon]|nr:MAG: hypothetical protein DRO89_02645 [Candidatus Altiarchaeales archaeon]